MRGKPNVMGITAPSSNQYIGILHEAAEAWLPRSSFSAGEKVFLPLLAAKGIHLVDKEGIDSLKYSVANLSDFPVSLIAEGPGWNGDLFVLHDGTTFAADSEARVPVAFDIVPGKNGQAGTLDEWKTGVPALLADQALGAFVMMAAFAPVLLKFMPLVPNFTLEIIGPEGIGKSTLLKAASSVFGGTGSSATGRYWASCTAGVEALGPLIDTHRDHPLILDEFSILSAAGDTKPATKAYLQLGHDLGRSASGRGPVGTSGDMHRTVVLLAANESLRSMAEKPPTEGDQIITLTAPAAWQFGLFQSIPAPFTNGAAFAEALALNASQHHGNAIREFLRCLFKDLKENPQRVRKRLAKSQELFLKECGVDRNSGRELRIARIFAAVYAAGRLANLYKILPGRCPNYRAAALTCHRLYQAATAPSLPFIDVIEALIASDRVVKIPEGDDESIGDLAAAAVGTLYFKSAYRELRIHPSKILLAFPNWAAIKDSEEVKSLLVREKGKSGQNKSKARLAPGQPIERLYCFRLPLPEPSIFDKTAEHAPQPSPDADDGWDDIGD